MRRVPKRWARLCSVGLALRHDHGLLPLACLVGSDRVAQLGECCGLGVNLPPCPVVHVCVAAQIWFPALPPAGTPAGPLAQGRGAAPPSIAEISMRRIEFVQLLLEDGSILQTLCTAL